MKIKSLLLGSAAAMAAVSGSHAADAIIAAEPEPVEYVRVCDAFGSGYFFIPGTETCLQISGRARMRVFFEDNDRVFNLDPADGAVFDLINGDIDSYRTSVRGRLNIRAKSDTELGELDGFLRLQADGGNDGSDANVRLDQGYLQLGGFLAGYTESNWVYSRNGGASGFGTHGELDGSYGYQQRNMLQYQFNGANWFAAIGVEDDNDTTTYAPDVVGRLGFVVGGVTVYGVVGWDQDNGSSTNGGQPLFTLSPTSDEWGVKLGLNADIGAAGNLIIQGYYASGATVYGANYAFWGHDWTPEWSILASYQYTFNPQWRAYVHGQYFADFYNPNNAVFVANAFVQDASTLIGFGGTDAYTITGGVRWDPVTNFSITTEVQYTDLVDEPLLTSLAGFTDNWTVLVQFQRDF